MDVEPLASMRCWPIEITLGGRTFDVPALPAVDWWPVLTSGDVGMILDFVESSPDDDLDLDDLLLEGAVTRAEIGEALVDALETTAGRSMHAATVLVSVANMHWATVNGALTRRGFRWADQPLGAALDAVYAEIVDRMDKEALDKFLALLDNEALTTGKPTPRQRNNSASEFESMAGPKPTGGAISTGGPSGSGRPKTRTRPRPPRQDAPSTEPNEPREPRVRNDPRASSGNRRAGAGPASGTEPLPPL
jgi:hypothetical protein